MTDAFDVLDGIPDRKRGTGAIVCMLKMFPMSIWYIISKNATIRGSDPKVIIHIFMLMILSLCKVQTVNYEKLATAFDSSASTSSNLRRIQRFMSNYQLNMDLVARFIYCLLPHQSPYALAMDRTCWDFAGKEINILVLSVIYRGCAFPILFSTCPGKGNSSWKDRAILINRFTDLFGEKSIASLSADREFIGSEWMNYLRSKKISFYLRIKGNYIVQTRSGDKIRIDRLFDFLKVNQQYSFKRMFLQKGTKCYLTGIRFINKEGKQELLVVASACPQTGTGELRCKTIFEENIFGSVTSAFVRIPPPNNKTKKIYFFIFLITKIIQ